jgi:hypothetical protein
MALGLMVQKHESNPSFEKNLDLNFREISVNTKSAGIGVRGHGTGHRPRVGCPVEMTPE